MKTCGERGAGLMLKTTQGRHPLNLKVNMEIILQENQEFRKKNNTQLEDIKVKIL